MTCIFSFIHSFTQADDQIFDKDKVEDGGELETMYPETKRAKVESLTGIYI